MQKLITSTYSFAADRFYDKVVVHGGFKLFGGNLNELAIEQGRRAVKGAQGGAVLDMPVGTAFFTVKIAARHDGLVVGADIASGMVLRAREVGRDAGVDNLEMLQADVHRLPFPDSTFAAVMCTNGLQVIPGLRPAVAELARVLAPGGTLFVSVLTLPAPRPLRAARKDRLPTVMLSGAEVAEAIAETGLEVVDTRRERLATLIEARKTAKLPKKQASPDSAESGESAESPVDQSLMSRTRTSQVSRKLRT